MICPICGRKFELQADTYRKYCSQECLEQSRRLDKVPPREPFEFICGHCGKRVITAAYNDNRIKYCSRRCHDRAHEQRKEQRQRGERGMSGGMSLSGLIRRERRDLD